MSVFPKKHHGPEIMCGGPQVCSDCEDRIYEASQAVLANFGTPDCYYCPGCGKKFTKVDKFIDHVSEGLMKIGKCEG